MDKAKIDKAVEDELSRFNVLKKHLHRENRAVKVRMLKLGWFYHNNHDFVTFAKLIMNLPNKVYCS